MKIIINDIALNKNFVVLINKLIKTANKFAGTGTKRLQVEVSFVGADTIQQLNRENRKIDKPTDVLSFPTINRKIGDKIILGEHAEDIDPKTKNLMLGDIIICEDVARNNAREYGHSFEREICYLVVHGFLHLLGYDHMIDSDKTVMRAMEEAVLTKFKITRETK